MDANRPDPRDPDARFDAIDRRILAILRVDGRTSHAAVAKEVGLSAPAVGERIRKLEAAGVIRGYRADLDPAEVGLGACAFVAIAPQPRVPGADLVERLLRLPEIEELHAVAGNYSYIAKVRVRDTIELDAFLDRLFMLEGVERTETTMVLRTNVERPMHLPFLPDPFGEGGGADGSADPDGSGAGAAAPVGSGNESADGGADGGGA